jgi:hypothetical protein
MRIVGSSSILLACLLCACSHNRQLYVTGPRANREVVMAAIGTKPVVLVTRNGAAYPVRRLRLSPDSAWGVPSGSTAPKVVAMADLDHLRVRSRGRGALDGMLIGTAAGLLGALAMCDGTCTDLGTPAGFGAIAGTLYGAGIGALIRATIRYRVVR